MRPWEMGSEFHLMYPQPSLEAQSIPMHGELFINGRAALRSILARAVSPLDRLWIPSYVCPDVHEALETFGNIRTYDDYPHEPAPRYDTLSVEPGDAVLIQDTFGLSDVAQWHNWRQNHPDLILIEDISHNCTQERYLKSPADYVFSSLRKSQPVADGGIIFAAAGGLYQSGNESSVGSRRKLEAMIIKAMYLDGLKVEKESFRALQIEGETEICLEESGGSLAHTQQVVNLFPQSDLWTSWMRNSERLRTHLGDAVFEGRVFPLAHRGTQAGLFHTVIKLESQDQRDRLKLHLIKNEVFPAVHWLQSHSSRNRIVIELSQTLLTLPTDYRYSADDIDRLAELLHNGLDQL